ncbi:S-layer homology domain-containing protein [Flavonifractor hominis]|uniref:S-layer homology domain-containing protein n=1 Tax=Flavonifractor hominis TaxID=3133178 RepID=A0ABV1EQC5_9FIRM
MKQHKQQLRRSLSLLLTLAMLCSFLVIPAAASEDADLPQDLDAIVDLLGGDAGVDGESAFDYLGTVFLGWRTTGGPWQNYVINDFIGDAMIEAGYVDAGDSYTGAEFSDKTHDYTQDFFWVQHDASSSLTWAPEYARMEITSIQKDGQELSEEDPLYALRDVVNVESYSFDPTSEIYQAHYIELYDLDAKVGDTDGFVKAMSAWINEKDETGKRVNVFPEGEEPGDPRGPEAHLNRRAHLATNTGFNVTAEELEQIRANPGNVRDLVAGKTGEVVYVGDVNSFDGDKSALKGKILLCDSANRNNFKFAQEVGAVSVMTTAALDNYSNPEIDDNWFGAQDPAMTDWYESWYGGTDEWYTNSARFAGGAGAASNQQAMNSGAPIVEWNISPDQYNAIRTLQQAGCTVTMNVATVGQMYGMSDPSVPAAQGQLTAIAEIKGSNPELQHQRIVLAAHVQEPGCDDNATGVALNMELAIRTKQLIDEGVLPRPERTIVFMWGDEMSFSDLYLDAHPDEVQDIICCIDLDMVGEDPDKTGGPMRIEKAPDPAAYYNYTLDNIPEDPLYYDDTRSDSDGKFVRLPDSHTLWGAGNPGSYDLGGVFINDLYMASAQSARTKVADTLKYDFAVDVCPYEGGSDHSRFLAKDVPAVLTWHFTDYVYHTTVDTLYMASADEMESVGITSLAAGYFAANPTRYTGEMLQILEDAAQARFDSEAEYNTKAHKDWADTTGGSVKSAYEEETEILSAWATWYREAIQTCAKYFSSNEELAKPHLAAIDAMEQKALADAKEIFLGEKLTLDNTDLIMDQNDMAFNASLTVWDTEETAKWSQDEWTQWAKGLTWWLTREGSEQDSALYPHVYTGDRLDNWTTWGSNGTDGSAYFQLDEVKVADKGDYVTVSLSFRTAAPFFYNKNGVGGNGLLRNSDSYRNVYGSFIGGYTFSVKDGDNVVATLDEPVKFNIYESYRRYADVMEELEQIKAAAEAKGRYFEITTSGTSEAGYDQVYVTLSDSAASVEQFQKMNQTAITDPASLQQQIKDKTLKNYRVPFMINNVHSDEMPGVDAQMDLLWELATADRITYNTLTGLKSGEEVDMSLFAPDVVDLGITGFGSRKLLPGGSGENNVTQGAGEIYNISEDIVYSVDELLDHLILVVCPNENPDGRTYNTRRNSNGFDLNRDASNQTQSETRGLAKMINEWNPVVFAELHGYMSEFLVEPCTPPHEPNLEYDLLVKNFMLGAEAYGMSALATTDKQYDFDVKFRTYYTPLRDDYDPQTMKWSAWDDLCTNYGPSYAMLNCGSLGYTIETPGANQASTQLFVSGMYGLMDYVMDHKEDIYLNQLEFFRRGIENEDHRADMQSWYVDISNQALEEDTWRVPYAENNNYFPEYYVIPVDGASQRDVADAYEMGQFLLRNGVQVSALDRDVSVDGTTYRAGTLVVDMHQAKRNYANAVLWRGADASASGFPELYSESVSNFPEMRGFDCIPVAKADAFAGSLRTLSTITPASTFSGVSDRAVVIANSGNEAVRAVNAMLAKDIPVGLITEGDYTGDFVVDYDDYVGIREQFTLTATGVSTMPVAYEIEQPTLFLTGRYDAFSSGKITEGYYAQWFSEGYGFYDYRNVYSNGTSAQDVMAYEKQLGFSTTSDPAKADVIVGSVAANQGETGTAAVEAIRSGVPYIATGSSPLRYIQSELLTDLEYTTLGMEALHTVTYPTDSLTTASYVGDEDFVTYTYNCGVITKLPEGAQVLIQAAEKDAFIAGCCLNDAGTPIDGYPEAFAIQRDGMDLTVFANSIVNRTHQQDDYRYVTNTIYSKVLSDEPMQIQMGGGDDGGSSGSGSSSGSTATIEIKKSEGGTVTADPKNPSAGSKVTLSVKANDGYELAGITVTDRNGKQITLEDLGSGKYSYTQPSGKVTVTATFRQVGAFTDTAGHWAADAIRQVAEQGLMNGVGGGRFAPDDTLSRAMVVTILYRMSGATAATAASFSDVPAGTWYTDAVGWAAQNGVVKGYGNGTFGPNDPISREQLAVILYRYAALTGLDTKADGADLTGFTDGGSVSSWAVEAMTWAVHQGLITGKPSNVLHPEGTATRGEAATILVRFLELK